MRVKLNSPLYFVGYLSALALLVVIVSSAAAYPQPGYPQQVYSATYRPGPTTGPTTTAGPPTSPMPGPTDEPTTVGPDGPTSELPPPPPPAPVMPDPQVLMGMMM